ncbi:DNA-binding transcriptional LysR family regulator [Paenibacillus cellulosilyticus]|uniref:DNA-binding transcriptional LysR family regulator n=1 Tax=Paenibacillus cellulosilyticus TaxID=375489 RepID=A0A2V2YVM6_9BACL|nr:LysR family transcriptional regulator [Paenibacillus cellulosilyticus]PWW05272.1 DNA-binding transcriptional LysR family regulator [Paenibacillus cellulosilyticus]QKS43596.1 LysR family transcriptional regulator [Paenibacillus cellulosilyticus]
MDFRQLRYFLAIAEAGQITRAAKALNMEQPPLSRQLKQMERELGVTLFDRSGKQLTLTHAGEVLRERAESVIRQLHESLQEVKEVEEGVSGFLAIGAVVSCVSLLPRAIERYREKYPQVTFKISEGDHYQLGEALAKRSIELVVARLPFEFAEESPYEYDELRLPSDPFVAVIPSKLQPDQKQSSITLAALADYPFLTLKTDQTIGMHKQVMSEFRKSGLTPNIICECSSVAIILSLVAAGIGATVLPKSVVAMSPIDSLRMLRIEDAEFQSEVGIVWLKDRYLSKSARHFIEQYTDGYE